MKHTKNILVLLLLASPVWAVGPTPFENILVRDKFYLAEPTGGGSSKLSITAPALASDYSLIMPVDDGTTGQVLTTNGTGTLSWAAVGSLTGTGTSGKVAKFTGTSSLGDGLLSDDGTNVTLPSGQFLAPIGSSGTPPYSFEADPDTGFGRDTLVANQVKIYTGGLPTMILTSSGHYIPLDAGGALTTGSTLDTTLRRDDLAGTWGIRNFGGGAGGLRLYEQAETDGTIGSNYERYALMAGSNTLSLTAETTGTGSDDLSINLTPAGTGTVGVGGNSTQAGTFRLYEDTDNGTNYLSIAPPASLSANRACVGEDDATPLDPCVTPNPSSITLQLAFIIGADNGSVLVDGDDQPTIWWNRTGTTATITEVACESDGGTPSINLQRDDGSAADILSSDLSCSTSGTTSSSFSGSEATIANDSKIDFKMVAAGGVAKRASVIIKYTRGL